MTKSRQIQLWKQKIDSLMIKRNTIIPVINELRELVEKYESTYSWMGDEIVRLDDAIKETEGK